MESKKQEAFELVPDEGIDEEFISETLEMMTDANRRFQEAETALIASFAEEAKTIQELLQDYIKRILSSIVESTINSSIPQLSKQKQELLNSYIQWGKLGWTYFPDAPKNLYFTPPVDMTDASARVKNLCTMQGMENIFYQLREQKVNHEDLESAIFCFRNRQYKACALMLFSLIDAKLIRVQPKGGSRRPPGGEAVKRLKKRFETVKSDKGLRIALIYSNLFACLETIFANGNDFKAEPDIINRNFVDHGMNHRRVRRRDCVQLFLVLNNLAHFLSEDLLVP